MDTTPSKTKKTRDSSSKSASKKDKRSTSKTDKDVHSNPSLDQVNDLKKKAILKTHGIENASTFEHPSSFSGTTGRLDPNSIKYFIQHSDIQIKHLDKEEIVFDLIGAEPPLANALRRILLSEIPTMAIEKVEMWQNTSIIPDENLAHRMGLIPIQADPHLFESKEAGQEQTSQNCLRFKLHAKCTKKDPSVPVVINNAQDDEKYYNHANVWSGDLEWMPIGDQAQTLKKGSVKPLLDDILIAKLRPGQEIEMEVVCEKGIGKTHAKWSPVCTAYYRLVPQIRLKQEITDDKAKLLKKTCPMGVFDIEDIGKSKKDDSVRAVVKDSLSCTTCRECIRDDYFNERIELAKIKDRFEFHVESVGVYSPEQLVVEAFKKLKDKASYWMQVLEEHQEAELDA